MAAGDRSGAGIGNVAGAGRRGTFRATLGLLLLSVVLLVAFFGHALGTHIMLPYPDPTPVQAAHERFQGAISDVLFSMTGASFAACVLSGVIAACRWLMGRLRRSSRHGCGPIDDKCPAGNPGFPD